MDQAPRSLSEMRVLLRRDDGWLASIGSYAPHRVLDDLLQRSERMPSAFPDTHLAGAAIEAVEMYLTTTVHLPSPRIPAMIGDLQQHHRQANEAVRDPRQRLSPAELADLIERDQLDAADLAARLHKQIQARLGDVESWGVNPKQTPPRAPTTEARLNALFTALRDAEVALSIHHFSRYANTVDRVGEPVANESHDLWRHSPPLRAFLRRAVQQYFNEGVTAIAYQDFRERFSLKQLVDRPADDREVQLVGGMLVSLARDLRAVRPLRQGHRERGESTRVALEVALQKIAERPGVPFVPRSGLVGKANTFISKVANLLTTPLPLPFGAGKPVAAAAQLTDAASGALREGLAAVETAGLYNAEAAARAMWPVYETAKSFRADIQRQAPEALTEQRFSTFLQITQAQQLLTQASRDQILASETLTKAPMSVVNETRRQRFTHELLWQYIRAVQASSPHAAPGCGLPTADTLFADPSNNARVNPTAALPTGVTDQGLLVAAIAVLQHHRGVPVNQLFADLEAGRLPGVRGTCAGDVRMANAASREWDLHCQLAPDNRRFVERALLAEETLRSAHEASATHSGYLGLLGPAHPPRDLSAPDVSDRAHLTLAERSHPLEGGTALLHRAPALDGLPGYLISEYAYRYADGRVRIPSTKPGSQPQFTRMAVVEAFQVARALLPPAARSLADTHALDIRWVKDWPGVKRPGQFEAAWERHHGAGDNLGLAPVNAPIRARAELAQDAKNGGREYLKLRIQGVLPPSMHDALGAVGVHPPEGYPLARLRPGRAPTPVGVEQRVQGTQPHLHALAMATKALFGEPVAMHGPAARVRPLQSEAHVGAPTQPATAPTVGDGAPSPAMVN